MDELDEIKQAAANGDIVAQVKLASRYFKGLGGVCDLVAALHWYKIAANNGSSWLNTI